MRRKKLIEVRFLGERAVDPNLPRHVKEESAVLRTVLEGFYIDVYAFGLLVNHVVKSTGVIVANLFNCLLRERGA